MPGDIVNHIFSIYPKDYKFVVAELGVGGAGNANDWPNLRSFEKYVLVDNLCTEFAKKFTLGHVDSLKSRYSFFDFYQEDSCETSKRFPDNYFDFVYIDSSHLYPDTLHELEAYKNKVKPDGWLCGHDYSEKDWVNVFRSVKEFSQNMGVEILSLGGEFGIKRTW